MLSPISRRRVELLRGKICEQRRQTGPEQNPIVQGCLASRRAAARAPDSHATEGAVAIPRSPAVKGRVGAQPLASVQLHSRGAEAQAVGWEQLCQRQRLPAEGA